MTCGKRNMRIFNQTSHIKLQRFQLLNHDVMTLLQSCDWENDRDISKAKLLQNWYNHVQDDSGHRHSGSVSSVSRFRDAASVSKFCLCIQARLCASRLCAAGPVLQVLYILALCIQPLCCQCQVLFPASEMCSINKYKFRISIACSESQLDSYWQVFFLCVSTMYKYWWQFFLPVLSRVH